MNRKVLYLLAPILIIFFTVFVVISNWDLDTRLILGHDVGYRLNSKSFFNSLFYLWSNNINFGMVKYVNPGAIPIHLPEVLLSFVSNDIYLNQTLLVIYWYVLFLTPFFAIYYLYFYKKDPKTIVFFIFAAILYSINFFNLQGWGVFWRTRFSIEILLPIFFAVLFKFLHDRKINYPILIILILLSAFLNGGGSPPLYASILLVWIATFLFFLITEKNMWKIITTFLKFSFIYSVGLFLLSAFWTIPYTSSAFISYNDYLANIGGLKSVSTWLGVITAETSFVNLFRLQGFSSWYDNPYHPYAYLYRNNPLLIIGSFAFVILSVSAFFFTENKSQKKLILLFYVFILLGMFFAAGSHPPLGWLYNTLFQYIPGFAIFRTSFYKFGPLLWFSMSMLSAFSLYQIGKKIHTKTKSSFLYFLYCTLIIVGIFAYHFPFFSPQFFKWDKYFSTQLKIPIYILDFKNWIDNDSSNIKGRFLLLPGSESSFNADAYSWGYWSLDPLPSMITSKAILYGKTGNVLGDNMLSELYVSIAESETKKFKKLSKMLDIEYIIVREDVFFNYKSREITEPKVFKEVLDQGKIAKPIKSFGKWHVYKVNNYIPSRFYLADSIVEIIGNKKNINKELELIPQIFMVKDEPENLTLKTVNFDRTVILPEIINESDESVLVDNFAPRIYPGSALYPVLEYKRKKARESLSSNIEIVNYYLGAISRSIMELFYLEDNKSLLVGDQGERLLEYLNELDKYSLKKSMSTRDYFKMISFLSAYERKLSNFPNDWIDVNIKLISKVRDSIQKISKMSNGDINCRIDCKVYSISFPDKKNYKFLVYEKDLPRIDKIKIGDNIIYDSSETRVEFAKVNDNWIVVSSQSATTDNLKVYWKNELIADKLILRDESLTKKIEGKLGPLTIAFNYVVKPGDQYVVTIFTKNVISGLSDEESSIIAGSGSYLKKMLLSHSGDTVDRITFVPKNVFPENESEIQNLRIISQPELNMAFLSENKSVTSTSSTLVKYEQKSPSEWLINSASSRDKFLVFTESFENWGIKSLPDHAKINGVFNGWLKKDRGIKDDSVVFIPQENLQKGIVISTATFVVLIVLLFVGIKKREKKLK